MPLISRVGQRSFKVRALYAVMFLLLALGAASMVYPLLIMISGSMQSDADSAVPSPYPQFWFDDTILFRKFSESKYNDSLGALEGYWGVHLLAWEKIERPPELQDPHLLQDYLDWRDQYPVWYLGFTTGGRMLPINSRLFRNLLYQRYHGDIAALDQDLQVPYKSWNHITAPPLPGPTRASQPDTPFHHVFEEYARTRPVYEHKIVNLDGFFRTGYIFPKYTERIEDYNQKHGTNYVSYDQVFLAPEVPRNEVERADWDDFVRNDTEMKLWFLHLSPSLAPNYRRYLAASYTDLAAYNKRYQTTFASFDEIPFSTEAPAGKFQQAEWDTFIKDRTLCPAEAIRIVGPRQSFEHFVAARRGKSPAQIGNLMMPQMQADWHDAMAHTAQLRWEFSTRNYKDVFGYILLHGNAILNTVIFCLLAIATHLLVNPFAAYALSRFKLPSTYTILLFCMATMAFPGEVTMIPRFLLLKSFPLWGLLAGVGGFVAVMLLLSRVAGRLPEFLRIVISLAIGVALGSWLVPALVTNDHVSLLNTFAALILPGMANGFSIFLLKGFFDSLPAELYEAADIDGASEWKKFWMITMGLSKPILAVIGLGAFTGAYSQFMMALIIIPDPSMWTLMVWLFQLQSTAHQSVIYASLVIAAVPTLLVFLFCQNLIIRGIIVPVEK